MGNEKKGKSKKKLKLKFKIVLIIIFIILYSIFIGTNFIITKEFKVSSNKIDKKTIKLYANAGKGGKLFGSITGKEISKKLSDEFSVEIDKRKIKISGDIKAYGTYECDVKLYTDITSKIYVMVVEKTD